MTAAEPITSLVMSGPACGAGARFWCIRPGGSENTLPADCTRVQIMPIAAGPCVVDVVVGGMNVHLEQQIVASVSDCCTGFVAANGSGDIDLRPLADGGADADGAP
jgi:hypothetical protein